MKFLWAFSTFAIGGPQRRCATLIERLGSDCSHVIVALDGRWDAEQFLSTGANWRKHRLDAVKSSFVSPANLRAMRKTLDDEAPDLLLTSNWGAIEWALANRGPDRRPHIHFEDGFGPDESPPRQKLRRVVARALLLRRCVVVVPSATLQTLALERWRLPKDRVVLIPNGVDVERYAGAPRKKAGRDIVVGSLGALRREKNYPRLVRATAEAARSGAARLVIVGEGAERAAIENEARLRQMNDRLSLPGSTSTPEKALADFDVFALSSDTEQAPLSLIEAMAAGLPVVATDVGDIKDMVAEANRTYVVAPDDEAGLASALAALVGDPDLRARLGAANAEKARRDFALPAMVERYRALFRDAVRR